MLRARGAFHEEGTFVIGGHRVRKGHDGAAETVIPRSEDGERFTTVATLEQSEFGAKSIERPRLVRTETGRWRLYVCCADPGSPHWWIDAIDADEPEGFAAANARTVFPGDRLTGVKDPLVQRKGQGWQAWICCHLLDQPGEEDRREYSLRHERRRSALGMARRRSRRTSWSLGCPRRSASPPCCPTVARPTMAEPPPSRTGSATHGPRIPERTSRTVATRRRRARGRPYLDVLPLPDGGFRIYYEARLPYESHELRTELVVP